MRRNMMAPSRDHCCCGNTTMHYVCLVEVHVAVNYIKILSVAHQCFYGKFFTSNN
jgi:hypothetical protein